MKHVKYFVMLVASTAIMLISSCRAHYPVAQQGGKEDVGYLLFVSASNQPNSEIEVILDNGTTFLAQTIKAKKANRRGTQYSVSTGRHQITVKQNGNILYQKNIMMSSQEVKQIQLP